MPALDGYGYKLAGGVSGSFLMDAGLSLVPCLLIAWTVMRRLGAGKLEIRTAGEPVLQPAA
jgi:hypothetical protein